MRVSNEKSGERKTNSVLMRKKDRATINVRKYTEMIETDESELEPPTELRCSMESPSIQETVTLISKYEPIK